MSSAGFFPGVASSPTPIFYSYAYPVPDGFSKAAVRPAGAKWLADLGEFVLPYDVVRESASPEDSLMEFLQSTYEAAATTGNWDRGLERTFRP